MEQILPIKLIAINPNVRNGYPRITNTTTCVSDLVMAMRFRQQTLEELPEWFALNWAQVYAALAYYHLHQCEIEEEIRARIKCAYGIEDKDLRSRY